MNLLIEDINSILKDFRLFLSYKLALKNNITGRYIFIIAILNIALFFSNNFFKDSGLLKFISLFLFFMTGTYIFKFLFLPFFCLIFNKIHRINALKEIDFLFFYSLVPFIFLYPLIYIGNFLSITGIIIFILIALWFFLFIEIFSFVYRLDFFNAALSVCGSIFSISFISAIFIYFMFLAVAL